MTLPAQCWSKVRIGGSAPRWWGCHAVLIGSEWVYVRPGTAVQEGAMCSACAGELRAAQDKARVRGEKAIAARLARGFGAGSGDAFR